MNPNRRDEASVFTVETEKNCMLKTNCLIKRFVPEKVSIATKF